ncbi:MAG TPA: cytochrome P450 [Holophagaceae bacterium]|nr:cytochrome P450 [Holophagaceae bacterium]
MTLPYAPGPRPSLPWSNLLRLRKDSLGFLDFLHAKYGDLVHFRMGSRHFHLVANPDLAREVTLVQAKKVHKGPALQRAKLLLGEGLLTSEGEAHDRQRRMMQPAFHHRKVAGYAELMVRDSLKMRDAWREGQELDVAHEMMALTLSIVAEALFGSQVGHEADEIGEALTTCIGMFNTLTNPFAEVLLKLPLPQSLRFQAALARLNQTIYRVIQERRAHGTDDGDLLAMLLHAQDDEGDQRGLTDEQVRDEAMTLFLAGHETTANALAWTWWLLSQNPDAEAALHAELDAVLQGRPPAFEDVPKLPTTTMVFAESMRLRPPVWAFGRQAMEDFELGGYRIRAGSLLLTSPWVIHHDPRWWPDPERFDPLRHTPEAKAARPKFAYLPFSHGPRNCIGEPFAWMEGVLLLATLAQKWKLRQKEGHPVVLDPLFTLRPKFGLRMVVERRQIL